MAHVLGLALGSSTGTVVMGIIHPISAARSREEADTSRRRDFRSSDGALVGRSYPKLPIPITVPRWDKSLGGETSVVKSAIHTGSSSDSNVAFFLREQEGGAPTENFIITRKSGV